MDLVVEYALPPTPPSGNHWSIRKKAERAKCQVDLTPWAPFATGDREWDAALRMYAETEELRHGLVHRDIKRDPQTGELAMADKRGQNAGPPLTMSDAEQLAFCRATRRLIEAILAGHIEPRERADLAFQLAEVHQVQRSGTQT